MRQTSGSVLCPSCGSLVGVKDEQCLICGRRNPGLWGFTTLLRRLGTDLGFVPMVLWGCGALYIATLAADPEGIRMQGLLALVSPSAESLLRFGASGAIPVFRRGRWWTVLSAGWLHGGILHIGFNMMWVRDLAPAIAHLYGPARTVIIYTASGATGFLASSLAGRYLFFMPRFLRGAGLTIGASASIFGLIGALLYYGRRGGSALISQQAKSWALTGLAFGFLMPGIDNWAHLGGLAGGYLTARWLDPLLPERGDHTTLALVCLLVSAASIVVSILLW
ncbi:MAG TPA: rhomboid family intramembrane serine protease [Vicinamibacteria bacterium]|nr:rhomboid family intramembrane serine protease [Vicinamibacteria bacterium]